MTQPSSPTWRRRCLATGLAAVMAMAGVGVAVAGQEGDSVPEPLPVAAPADVSESTDDSTVDLTTDSSPSPQWTPPVTDAAPEAVGEAPPPAQTSAARSGSTSASRPAAASSRSSDPVMPSTSTTLDVDRMLDRQAAASARQRPGAEGLAADLEQQVRACVADFLAGAQSSFEGKPDEDRIQSFASEAVDDVLACVAGLVDVGQVLGCVSEVIQEIVAVVLAMDLEDLPELISDIADDVVRCVSR